MKLLLHICCANCGIVPIELLQLGWIDAEETPASSAGGPASLSGGPALPCQMSQGGQTNADNISENLSSLDLPSRRGGRGNQRKSASLEVTLFWYNPNIQPKEEYQKRLADVQRLATIYNLGLIEDKYDIEKWFKLAKGLENEGEGGKRCEICFKMRLEKTVQFAQKNKFDYFATSLGISRYKNTDLINQIGRQLADKYKIKYYQFTIDKNKVFQRELKLSKKYNFYRQKYCGCLYSLKR